jgi:hypothetical protein
VFLSESKNCKTFSLFFSFQSVKINKEGKLEELHEKYIGKYRNAFNKLFNKIYAFF